MGCAAGTLRKIEADDELRPSKQLAEILAQKLDLPHETHANLFILHAAP